MSTELLQFKKGAERNDYAEQARALYRKADASALAVLIFEAMLLGSAGQAEQSKDDDLLAAAATIYKIDAKALRAELLKSAKKKAKTMSPATAKKTKPKETQSEE